MCYGAYIYQLLKFSDVCQNSYWDICEQNLFVAFVPGDLFQFENVAWRFLSK